MSEYRVEFDSIGEVKVPADKLWGAQTQRSIEHFSIGRDLIPREMIPAYAVLKKAAALSFRPKGECARRSLGEGEGTSSPKLPMESSGLNPVRLSVLAAGTECCADASNRGRKAYTGSR